MRNLILFLVLVCSINSYAQTLPHSENSLLLNYGFDITTTDFINIYCHTQPEDIDGDIDDKTTHADMSLYYSHIYNWTYPEQPNTRKFTPDIWKDDLNGQEEYSRSFPCFARAGGRYDENSNLSGFWDNEILVGEFHQNHPLKANQTYLLEYYIANFVITDLPHGFTNVGLKFVNGRPEQKRNGELDNYVNNQHPQVTINLPPLDQTKTWYRVVDYYTPDNDYSNVLIGGFKNNEGQDIFWDDIRITNVCWPKRLYDNVVFDNENMIYQATNEIIAGKGVDQDIKDGPTIVKSNSMVAFEAANRVVLEPGFTAEEGSRFVATIKECSPDICPSLPNVQVTNHFDLCEEEDVTLGFNPPNDPLVAYHWEPSTYLSNPNTPNPVFNNPGGAGSQHYTLTVKNICGRVHTENVEVVWGNGTPPDLRVNIKEVNDYFLYYSAYDANSSSTNSNIEYITVEIPSINYFEKYYQSDLINNNTELEDIIYLSAEVLSVCNSVDVIISLKNICNPEIDTYTTIWNRSTSQSVISYNLDGNDNLVFEVKGADTYSFTAKDASQTNVYQILNEPIIDGNDLLVWSMDPSLPTGIYSWELELSNICTRPETYTGQITKTSSQPRLTGPNTNKEDLTILFPNPTSDEVHISNNNGLNKISVYNSFGQLILTLDNIDYISTKVDLSIYPNGIYLFYIVTSSNELIGKKVIKH